MKRISLAAAGLAMSAASFPAIAAAPDTEAVEFYNVHTKHYFITASASEAGMVDAGQAGPGWVRTGRSFLAWLSERAAPQAVTAVCRFYSYRANSHFYTPAGSECEGLKAAASGWTYEGIGFRIQTPVNGQCPAGTIPMRRMYNDGFATGEGANHRFVDDAALGELMAETDWIAEGVAFCAQPKANGSNANLKPTATSFEVLAGTWNGDAKWIVEEGGTETAVMRPLELTFTEEGAITGSGYGCTFTGETAFGDGFRSFFMGAVTAAGCTDPAFNGDYSRLKLQRFGNGTLMVKLRKGDGEEEVAIMARMSLDGVIIPPPGPPTSTIAGKYAGTVRWEAGSSTDAVEANKLLELEISTTGAVTGSGFGCTFTGEAFGDVEAAGCENTLFNGTYRMKARSDHKGRLKVSLEREGDTEAEIEGFLLEVNEEEEAA